MALLKGFENGLIALVGTNPATQSQVPLFTARAKLWPGDAGEIISLPVGPEEGPQFTTVYNCLIGGRDENPDIDLPQVGDELSFTGKDNSSALFNGQWRIIADPLVWVGGKNGVLNTIQFKVVRT
jgi:hypothetical protein